MYICIYTHMDDTWIGWMDEWICICIYAYVARTWSHAMNGMGSCSDGFGDGGDSDRFIS